MRAIKLSAGAVNSMRILEFSDLINLPLMKTVRKKFLRLVKAKHPDGGIGSEEDFVELQEIKDFLLNYIKNNQSGSDPEDEEESLIRGVFEEANIQKAIY